jgi:hypothetical protein
MIGYRLFHHERIINMYIHNAIMHYSLFFFRLSIIANNIQIKFFCIFVLDNGIACVFSWRANKAKN